MNVQMTDKHLLKTECYELNQIYIYYFCLIYKSAPHFTRGLNIQVAYTCLVFIAPRKYGDIAPPLCDDLKQQAKNGT